MTLTEDRGALLFAVIMVSCVSGSLPPATEDFDEENNIKTITEYKYNEDNKMVKVN